MLRKNTKISSFFLVLFSLYFLTACNSGIQAVTNENWTVAELITKGERTDVTVEVVEVRNCSFSERKAIDCSAGTSNDLTVSLGGSVGIGAGFEGAIDASVSSGLGIGRNSGQTLNLDLPPDGSIYLYTITKRYNVLAGEVVARSTAGKERQVAYAFHSSCSLTIESREIFTCAGLKLPPPPSTPTQQTPLATTIPTSYPTHTPPPNTSSDLSSRLYILGYSSGDLAVRQAIANCSTCQVLYLSSLNELPDDEDLYTFNLASLTKNLPDGCRSKQELISLGVTLMIVNNYTPCNR